MLILISGTACKKEEPKRKFTLVVGSFWTEFSTVQCDSFTMINQKEAICWVDGIKIKLIATKYISPRTNNY